MKDAKALLNYSRALFELAQEQKASVATTYLQELELIGSVVSKELLAFCENPSFHQEEKRTVIREISKRLKLDDTLLAFLVLLVESGRLRQLKQVTSFYRQQLYRQEGKQLMTISTAKELGDKERQQIVGAFTAKLKGKYEVDEKTDPELIGGVVVQIGSTVYDGSVRGRIAQLRSRLMEQ